MKPSRFDAVTKLFADRRLSRRTAVGTSLAAGAAAVTRIGTATAQDATPAATPEVMALPLVDQPPAQLFVQAFRSGSIAPSVSEFGTHTVTLAQGMGQTIVFTDRPSREVFTTSTPAFLDGLGFEADNPPNAAILMEAGDGTTDLAVVELFNPTYDEATHTATYDISVLANWQNDLEMGFQQEPTDLANVATEFGATHLFIDDCGFGTLDCLIDEEIVATLVYVPLIYFGPDTGCFPYAPGPGTLDSTRTYYAAKCNEIYPDACEGRCDVEPDYS